MINPDNEFSEGTPSARTRKQYNDIISLCQKRDKFIDLISFAEDDIEFVMMAKKIYKVHQEIKALRGDK